MDKKASYVFHLIGNSHLDPVWLWDWREGMNEGLITVRTMLQMMKEFPRMTYTRGESAIYEHVEKYDPASFRQIQKYVSEGRWDIVGGTYVQPDTNMTSTETWARHFLHGQTYLGSKFGVKPTVAWAADSFGHCSGLPTIYAQAGIKYYACFRPPNSQFPLTSPAFWWKGRDGSKILAYRPLGPWYGCEREEMASRLDLYLNEAKKYPFRHIAVFFGLGNHGGGPSRRHLHDIEDWLAKHPEVEGRFSGLHKFFEEFERDAKECPRRWTPDINGELNFTMRGVYSAGAKFKYPYRKAEAQLVRAETMSTAIGVIRKKEMPSLHEQWNGLLFNSFHDILPATCTERALNEQVAWVKGILHDTEAAEFDALNILAQEINAPQDQVPGDHPQPVNVLVWNPHPYRYTGPLELEVALDYRPLFSHRGRVDELNVEIHDAKLKPVPFQSIRVEHNFMADLPWRHRVVLDADLPPLGWSTYTFGYSPEDRKNVAKRKVVSKESTVRISSDRYTIEAKVGEAGIHILDNGQPLFSPAGFGLKTVEDGFGPWGNHYEEAEAEDNSTLRHQWKITQVETLEDGPIRSAFWVRFVAGQSRAEFTILVQQEREVIDFKGRVFWNEGQARLKLVMPGVGTEAEYDVPGGATVRGSMGEVPGSRYVRLDNGKNPFVFASNALYNFDLKQDTLCATVVRTSRHALDVPDTVSLPERIPVIDSGEYTFNFFVGGQVNNISRLADELERPPVSLPIIPKKGRLDRQGSLLEIGQLNLRLLAFKSAQNGKGLIVRLQEIEGKRATPSLRIFGISVKMPAIEKYSIATYLLRLRAGKWQADRVGINES